MNKSVFPNLMNNAIGYSLQLPIDDTRKIGPALGDWSLRSVEGQTRSNNGHKGDIDLDQRRHIDSDGMLICSVDDVYTP